MKMKKLTCREALSVQGISMYVREENMNPSSNNCNNSAMVSIFTFNKSRIYEFL